MRCRMSIKKPVISQRLKVLINRMESNLSLPRRIMRAKSAGSSYSVGWQWVNTKPVKSSLIYLYELGKYNGSHPTLGISFEFYDEYEFRIPKPLHEQKVCFSLCLDPRNPDKLIEYSKPLDLVQAKAVLKEISMKAEELKQLKPLSKSLNAEQVITLIRVVAFGYTEDSLNADKDMILSEFEGDINEVLEIKNSLTQSEAALLIAGNSYRNDLHNSDEYKTVEELKNQLEKAQLQLKLKDKEISDTYKLKQLRDAKNSALDKYQRTKELVYCKVRKYMGHNGISYSLITVIENLIGKER